MASTKILGIKRGFLFSLALTRHTVCNKGVDACEVVPVDRAVKRSRSAGIADVDVFFGRLANREKIASEKGAGAQMSVAQVPTSTQKARSLMMTVHKPTLQMAIKCLICLLRFKWQSSTSLTLRNQHNTNAHTHHTHTHTHTRARAHTQRAQSNAHQSSGGNLHGWRARHLPLKLGDLVGASLLFADHRRRLRDWRRRDVDRHVLRLVEEVKVVAARR